MLNAAGQHAKSLIFGRGGEIRTRDHLHPMQVRYQAALRPEVAKVYQRVKENASSAQQFDNVLQLLLEYRKIDTPGLVRARR